MKIACIDFETANGFQGSVCAVGVVVVQDGALADSFYSLVRPHADCGEFNPFNIRVHGIHPKDVADAPEFDAVYERMQPLLCGALLAAHNASFDMTCLRRVLALYGIAEPQASYLCTCRMAQRAWPALHNHRLNTVAASLGHRFAHHNALEDARACAVALLAAMEQRRAADPLALLRGLGLSAGCLGAPAKPARTRPARYDPSLPF